MNSILIFDPDPDHRRMLVSELTADGYLVDEALNKEQFLQKLNEKNYDVIIVEPFQQDEDDILILVSEQQKEKNFKWIVLTVYSDVKTAINSARLGASDILSKPWDTDELLITVRKVLEID